MAYSYSFNGYEKEHMAKAVGRYLPISTKQSIEICSLIRHKRLREAKEILGKVTEKKAAVPYRRFNRGVGHKKGIGPGRFPVKASQEIIGLLDSVEANAQFKGLDTSSLVITHICANRASRAWRYGRRRRIKAKRTNIEIVAEERKAEPSKKKKENVKKEGPK